MWKSPRYDELTGRPSPDSGPPREDGERLLTLPRGADQELRLNRCEFEGRPYLALRVWERNPRGEWWPTRKGCSVRIGECARLAEVLAAVAGRYQGNTAPGSQAGSGASPAGRDGGSSRPGPPPRGRPRRAPGDVAGASDVGPGFSEL